MLGKKFGKWTILKEYALKDKHGALYHECKCDCGNIKYVRPDYLTKGKSKGCYSCNKRGTRHGYAKTSTYKIWQGMLGRCYNSNNANFYLYGERGIKVCERWHEFENFLADIGERPEGKTLDRINPDGDYSPHNCRWATMEENLANRRISKKHSSKYRYVQKSKLCKPCLDKFIVVQGKKL